MKILVTCEHGGNQIPKSYQTLFQKYNALLQTHRGYDIGALSAAKKIAASHADKSYFIEISRLFIELNRSLRHPKLFSEVTKTLSDEDKKNIIDQYYLPHRKNVESTIRQWNDANHTVLHLAIHSFTPEMDGNVRQADIGLLFDPKRLEEKLFCLTWQKKLKMILPEMTVRRNYPYKGTSDGLTVYLRKLFPDPFYAGVELEINQKFFSQSPKEINLLLNRIADSLKFLKKHGE